MKKIMVVLALVAGFLVTGVSAASAHTPSISASCTGVDLSGSSYESDKTNTWTVTVGGSTQSGTFGESFSKHVDVSQDGATTSYSAHIQAEDGGYVQHKSGSIGPCGTPPSVDVCSDLPGNQPTGTDCTQPADQVVVTDGKTEAPNCDTLEVVTHHKRTTTPYVFDQKTNTFVLGKPVVTEYDTSRHVTREECPVTEPPAEHQTRDVVDNPVCESGNYSVTTEHQSRDAVFTFNDETFMYDKTYTDWTTDSTDSRPATLEECPAPPQPAPVVSDSPQTQYNCGDDHSTTYVTTTTTGYVLDVPTRTWLLGDSVVTQSNFTEPHFVALCPLPLPGKAVPPAVLPATGGPKILIAVSGILMTLIGGAIIIAARRDRRFN